MANHQKQEPDDPFLLNYSAADLRIASEFLSNWLPFLSRGLCRSCRRTISDRVRSLDLGKADRLGALRKEENCIVPTLKNMDTNGCDESLDNYDTNSLESRKDDADVDDIADTNSLGSWKDGADGSSEPVAKMEAPSSERLGSFPSPFEIPRMKMSWADMAQEDELDAEEENEVSIKVDSGNGSAEENITFKEAKPKTQLTIEQREYIRFTNVKRKKDFICLERVKGKIVNILDGLELHTSVFSAVEQKRIVDYVEMLQEMGKKGELKARTFSAPQKWMRGKGRVTIQFGCCYNYARDKNGNPPGILKNEAVDPIPNLFKVMIKRLIRWHVLPPSCVPDSCIVNIYDEGDCIPPHIDNHDFVRPFCTVSFLSECNIVFGSELKIVGPGEFSGSIAIPLPVGSVLVLNGNGADIAKHCVPAVPTKRISITFRKMDELKWPNGYVPEPDLQGLKPLHYGVDRSRKLNSSKPREFGEKQVFRRHEREENGSKTKGSTERGSDKHHLNRTQQGPWSSRGSS